eukprot:scaffold109142_cov38-Phaeocystis_antarctica.AAC.1
MSATRCRIGLLPHGACTGCSTCTAMCCSIAHRVLVRRPAASHLGAARRRDEQLGRELHSRYVTKEIAFPSTQTWQVRLLCHPGCTPRRHRCRCYEENGSRGCSRLPPHTSPPARAPGPSSS